MRAVAHKQAGPIDRPASPVDIELPDPSASGRDLLVEVNAIFVTLVDVKVPPDVGRKRRHVPGAAHALVVIGGGGGGRSVAIQLARQLTDLTVIATASRLETREPRPKTGSASWARITSFDRSRPLAPQIAELGIGDPAFVF